MKGNPVGRPSGITGLCIFFAAGALISSTSVVSLLLPGSVLEPIWRLNPRAQQAFTGLGGWAVLLLSAISLACASSAAGLWLGRLWGYKLAFVLIATNLLGDTINVLLGIEPRAVIGIPIAIGILAFLRSRGVRDYFGTS